MAQKRGEFASHTVWWHSQWAVWFRGATVLQGRYGKCAVPKKCAAAGNGHGGHGPGKRVVWGHGKQAQGLHALVLSMSHGKAGSWLCCYGSGWRHRGNHSLAFGRVCAAERLGWAPSLLLGARLALGCRFGSGRALGGALGRRLLDGRHLRGGGGRGAEGSSSAHKFADGSSGQRCPPSHALWAAPRTCNTLCKA